MLNECDMKSVKYPDGSHAMPTDSILEKPTPSCADAVEPDSLRADEALSRILSTLRPIGQFQYITTGESSGRILDQTIQSPIDVPGHTNSAVDGYAVNSSDLSQPNQTVSLKRVGTALAGKPYLDPVESGQTVAIMTGAPMPQNCDTVVMQEHIRKKNDLILFDQPRQPHQNVRLAGEDIQKGEKILTAGRRLTPPDVGLIASLGIGQTRVLRRPKVAILSTGDELFNIGSNPTPWGFYDSNRFTLSAALKAFGVEVYDMGIIKDNPPSLLAAFEESSRLADIVISTGGVSVGEADHTKTVLRSLGTVEFWKVTIKPGRPMAFGQINNATFFGLPGNPVAVMVTYYQFVLPALEKIMGFTPPPLRPTLKARCSKAIRKKPGRTEVQRGILETTDDGRWLVHLTGKQGSGILRSMSLANCFILLPHEGGDVEMGELVTVQPFINLFYS